MTSSNDPSVFEYGVDGPKLIVVGLDGSDSSWRAAAYAAGLARRQHSKLVLVYVQTLAAGAFAQTLRRYTSLNHLAQAARAVLQNTAQINQMLSDLNRVDFANVQVSAGQGRWTGQVSAGRRR